MTLSGGRAASRRRFLTLSGASLLVAGCSDLVGQTPPQLFRLQPARSEAADLPAVPWQLIVSEPIAPQGFDTTRIALSRSPVRRDYFADSAWTDRAPAMIQGLIIESFENTGKILAVGRLPGDLRADYALQTELRDFEAQYADANAGLPKIHVRIEARLIRLQDREIAATMSFAAEGTPARNDIDSIIAGFDDALGDVLNRLVAWTLRTPR
jgi:cholesterol transport system auxiliary component